MDVLIEQREGKASTMKDWMKEDNFKDMAESSEKRNKKRYEAEAPQVALTSSTPMKPGKALKNSKLGKK